MGRGQEEDGMSGVKGEEWRNATHRRAVKMEDNGQKLQARKLHGDIWADAKAELRVQRARERAKLEAGS